MPVPLRRQRGRRWLAGVAAAMLLHLAVFGCTVAPREDPGSPSVTAATPDSSEPNDEVSSPDPAGQPFGTQCPNLPAIGNGSLQDLSNQDWLTATASIPALSQLSVITTVTELRDDLASQQDVTVFAPTNAAFLAMGVTRARQLLTNPSEAGNVLRYHVVPGRLAANALAGKHQTLTGQSLEVTGSGEEFRVDGRARVVCGNIQTTNATLYLIDQVLVPS